MHQRNRVVG